MAYLLCSKSPYWAQPVLTVHRFHLRPSPFLPSAHWFHLPLPPSGCSSHQFHIQRFAASPHGVSVPLATSPLGVLVPLAPPAGVSPSGVRGRRSSCGRRALWAWREGGRIKGKLRWRLDEADKIMEMAKMLADEDDPFARHGLYAFLDAEMKALRTLVIWCSSPNNSPFSLYSDGLFGASSSPRLRAGVLCGKKGGYSQSAGSISIGSMSMSAGLRSAGRSPTRSVAPGRQGISRDPSGGRPRSGSCMRRSTARIRPPCALRCALVSRSASRRIPRRPQEKPSGSFIGKFLPVKLPGEHPCKEGTRKGMEAVAASDGQAAVWRRRGAPSPS